MASRRSKDSPHRLLTTESDIDMLAKEIFGTPAPQERSEPSVRERAAKQQRATVPILGRKVIGSEMIVQTMAEEFPNAYMLTIEGSLVLPLIRPQTLVHRSNPFQDAERVRRDLIGSNAGKPKALQTPKKNIQSLLTQRDHVFLSLRSCSQRLRDEQAAAHSALAKNGIAHGQAPVPANIPLAVTKDDAFPMTTRGIELLDGRTLGEIEVIIPENNYIIERGGEFTFTAT